MFETRWLHNVAITPVELRSGHPLVVGSIGDSGSLISTTPDAARESCNLVEIRLDLLDSETLSAKPWRKFEGIPLLFTSRCESEGGAAGLTADERKERLLHALDDASLVDVELASAAGMDDVITEIKNREIPWIASFHDFHGVPAISELSSRRKAAKLAGAAAFKAAVTLGWNADQIGPLSLFMSRSKDYPVSLMGMGPLAPASRVLFAQLGSVLNYGYLGDTPTAPGQWSAKQLKEAISSVSHKD